MRRNRKATVLVVVTVLAAGCARSDFRATQNQGRWRPVTDEALASAPEAKPPKVLPQTHMAAGRLFESQGLLDKAVIQYRKAVAVNHNYWEAYHRLGLVLGFTGQHEEALRAMSRAVELQPGNALLRNDLGFELVLAGRWADAEKELSRAVGLNPAFARAWVNLGMVQSQRGRFDEALASFRKALPEPDAYYNLGLMYRGQRQYANAADAFAHVLEINPAFSAAQVQLQQLGGLLPPVPAQEPTPGFVAATHAAEPANEPPVEPDTVDQKGFPGRADEPSEEPLLPLPGEEPDTPTGGALEAAWPMPQSPEVHLIAATDAGTGTGPWIEEEPFPDGQSGIEGEWPTDRELQSAEEPCAEEQPQVAARQEPGKEAGMTPLMPTQDSSADRADEDVTRRASETWLSSAQDHKCREAAAAPVPAVEDATLDHQATTIDHVGFPTCATNGPTDSNTPAARPLAPWTTLEALAKKLDTVRNEIAFLEDMADQRPGTTASGESGRQAATGELRPVAPEIGYEPRASRTIAEQSVPPAERKTERSLTATPDSTPADRRHEARLVSNGKIIPPGSAGEATRRDSRGTGTEPSRRPRMAATVTYSPEQGKTTNRGDWRARFRELESWMQIVQDEIACWDEADLLAAQSAPSATAPRFDDLWCIEEDAICPIAPGDSLEAPSGF